METGLKPFYFASFLVTGIFSFFFPSLQTSLNCENRDNEPKRSRLKPVNEKDETQDQGTLELDICYYRFIDGTSFVVVVVVVVVFLFSLRPSGSYALAFSFWHSLEDQLFSDPFAVL